VSRGFTLTKEVRRPSPGKTHEPGSLGSVVLGQPSPTKQTRHVPPAPSQGGTGELSGRNRKVNVWRRESQPDGDRWESLGNGVAEPPI
jgi:hypothetical protein